MVSYPVYEVELFMQANTLSALLDDWLGSDDSDLLYFIPLDWTITVAFSDYEIYLFTSRYNWLDRDCLENGQWLSHHVETMWIGRSFPFRWQLVWHSVEPLVRSSSTSLLLCSTLLSRRSLSQQK